MIRLIAAVVLTLVPATALAQISVDEAQKKFIERQEAKQKAFADDRAQLVTITKGELDDLKTELAALKKEVANLRANLAAAQPPPETSGDTVVFQKAAPKTVEISAGLKYVPEIKPGVTREQLFTYLAQHKDNYRMTKDLRQSAEKQELMTVERFRVQRELVGTTSNGVSTTKEYHDVKVPIQTWELILVDGVITDMTLAENRRTK